MLDEIIEAVVAIFTKILEVLADLFEALISLFFEEGEAPGAGQATIIVPVFLAELIWWLVLIVAALLVAAFGMKRPVFADKPKFWRPESGSSRRR